MAHVGMSAGYKAEQCGIFLIGQESDFPTSNR